MCVNEARFDESTGLWHVIAQSVREVSQKSYTHYVSKLFILAVGGLSHPKQVTISGQEQFQGSMFHSQRWDHSIDLDGKDVVVVGNGCTATQIVPALVQRGVKSLTQFASSKQWIAPEMPTPVAAIPGMQWSVEHIGFAAWMYRASVFMVTESMFSMMRLNRLGEWYRNR